MHALTTTLRGLAIALLIAAGVSACGSSGGHVHRRGSSSAGAQVTVGGQDGVMLTVPSAFHRLAGQSTSTLQSAVYHTADNSATITVHIYRHAPQTVDQFLRGEEVGDSVGSQVGTLKDVHARVEEVKLPGTTQAKELIETYRIKNERQRSDEVVGRTPSGTLVDVVADASQRAPSIDPASIVASVHLAGNSA